MEIVTLPEPRILPRVNASYKELLEAGNYGFVAPYLRRPPKGTVLELLHSDLRLIGLGVLSHYEERFNIERNLQKQGLRLGSLMHLVAFGVMYPDLIHWCSFRGIHSFHPSCIVRYNRQLSFPWLYLPSSQRLFHLRKCTNVSSGSSFITLPL